MYKVTFPGYKFMSTQSCESTGQETIYNFVKSIFQLSANKRWKPNLEKMVFCNFNSECLNVGLPVGVLSTEETYECYFKNKNLKFDPSDLCRQFAVEDYSSHWKLSYFRVLCSEGKIAPGVSDFSRINITKRKVYFFTDETISEALVRDNRFKEEKLRSCWVDFDQTRTRSPLSSKAVNIQGKDIEIVPLNVKDSKLPKSVSLRPHPNPSLTVTRIKPKQIKQENASAASSASCLTPRPVASSTPVTARQSLKTTDNSAPLIEITFGIQNKTITIGENAVEVIKPRIRKLENFALKQGLSFRNSELEYLTKIGQSVGAIFKLDPADRPHLVGTCFRIGAEYIITNYHVFEEIRKIPKKHSYVNFNFKDEGEEDSQRRFIASFTMWSTELDYAILKMDEPHEQLPRSIFSHGISIMNPACPESNSSVLDNKHLRLIGHPRGEPEQTDLMCTINARRQSGLECWCYTLRRGEKFEGEAVKNYNEGKDRRRRTYQSSNFFHGSSGSPGIVCLNGKKWLVALHARGFRDDKDNFFVEQGVLLTEIYKDVQKQINEAQRDQLKDIRVEDLFPSVDCAIQACWGEPMEH